MDVSLLLPTNKPFEGNSQVVIDSINKSPNPNGYSYEIVVASQQEIKGQNVRWVEETNPLGPMAAFNYMANSSKADFLITLVDDVQLNNIFMSIDFLRSDRFKNKRFHIATLANDTACYIWKEFGGYLMMRYPVLSTRTLHNELAGHLFHPDFFYHFCDHWLGFYIGAEGEPGVECDPNITGRTGAPYIGQYDEQDCATLRRLIDNYRKGNRKYVG